MTNPEKPAQERADNRDAKDIISCIVFLIGLLFFGSRFIQGIVDGEIQYRTSEPVLVASNANEFYFLMLVHAGVCLFSIIWIGRFILRRYQKTP